MEPNQPPYQSIQILDERLRKHGLRRVAVPTDGNCFFHAVSRQLETRYPAAWISHDDLREKCTNFLEEANSIGPKRGESWKEFLQEENAEAYLTHMSQDGQWVDHLMVQAAASVLHCVITIITTTGDDDSSVLSFQPKTPEPNIRKITLGHVAEYHYFSAEKDGFAPDETPLEGKSISSAKEGQERLGKAIVPPLKSAMKSRGRRTTRKTTGVSLHAKFQDDENLFKKHKDSIAMRGQRFSQGLQYEDSWRNDSGGEDEGASGMFQTGARERNVDNEMESLFQEPKKVEDPLWDRFDVAPPPDDSKEHTGAYRIATFIAKYVMTFFFCAAVAVGSIASKGSLLVLTNAYSQSYDTATHCPTYKGEYYYIKYKTMLILIFCLCFPEVLSFCYCLYRIVMKKEKAMDWGVCFWGMIPEILHAVGLSFLVLKVAPNVDATLCVLMFSLIGVVPSMIHLHAKYKAVYNKNKKGMDKYRTKRIRDFALSIIASILQPAGIALLCWRLYEALKPDKMTWDMYLYIILSLVFVSCRHWENFVTGDFKFFKGYKIKASMQQQELDRVRFKTGIIYAFVRICFIVGTCFLIYFVIDGNESIVRKSGDKVEHMRDYSPRPRCKNLITWYWLTATAHCFCGLGVFFFGRIACQTMAQIQGYSFPLVSVTPVMCLLTALYSMYGAVNNMSLPKYFKLKVDESIADYVRWTSFVTPETLQWQVAVVSIVGLVAGWLTLIFLTVYLWHPKQDKLARTEVLFVKPMYAGVLINEELMLNRRQYHSEFAVKRHREQIETNTRRLTQKKNGSKRMSRRLTVNMNRKFTPQVFLCATMWHETEQEMTQLLTSIMRLDRHQGIKSRKPQKDKDFYHFQVHVMFDDAMELTANGPKPNKFVNELVKLIPVAANKVKLAHANGDDHNKGEDISPPVIYPTPYGGRLEFVLPYGNMFHVHLKDKQKIRHRKRWSQCMYMYYILGFLQQEKKAYKPDDVFILALDGDVDFQPESLLLLLDRMKRNPDVGAACGRIHPTGSGPVVWFQKFEYAVGHWLQKTAEHVLGCVLCSPGCFSLFRGVALMDTNVVKMYTTKATEARHYIQWDQGEDRWLCTLLLKQGWRIEYSAASDSYTFAPEEFKEFYNQRRRWGPSTMANVFDILQDATITVKNNEYISWGYITYQMGLMASSILGPATVVLIVQGAFQYVFQMTPLGSLLVALIPVVIFVILCYTTDQDFQIAVAGILTIIYALVMMAVLVGIVGQMTETLLNPNSIFMLAMIGIYAFTGIIHPTEMLCLLHGILYYLLVPSAFILLMVYSLCNMNNVSWGTREVRAPVAAAEAQEQKAIKEQAQGKSGKKSRSISSLFDSRTTEGYGCRLGNLCKIAFCLKPRSAPTPQAYHRVPTEELTHRRKSTMHKPVTGVTKEEMIRKYSIAKATFMGERDDRDHRAVRKSLHQVVSVNQLRSLRERGGHVADVAALRGKVKERRITLKKSEAQSHERAQQIAKELREPRKNPNAPTGFDDYDSDAGEEEIDADRLADEKGEGLYWILDGPMTDGLITFLDENEYSFWDKMIKKYLLPLDEDKKEQARIKADLKALRNKMTGAYYLINSLWIVLTFSLTLAINDINITYEDKNGNEIVLQPLAFLFLIFFLVILVIQFVTMLVHRWSTFVHLMAATSFDWKKDRSNPKEDPKQESGSEESPRKKKYKKRAKKQAKTVEVDVESGVSRDNAAFEDSNFTYKAPITSQPNGGPEIVNLSDTSDLDEPHVTEFAPGSLRWKDSQGLAASLAKASSPPQADDPSARTEDSTYEEIILDKRSPRDSLHDNNQTFFSKPPTSSQPWSPFQSSDDGMSDDVTSNPAYQEDNVVSSDPNFTDTAL